jgi:hypothetical protein
MNIVERAKKIMLQPGTEWPVIAGEPSETRALFLGYAAPLAAIGPVAAWLGHSVIGVSVPLFGTVRTPFMTGLAFAIVTYALALVGAFVIGLIIDALAPTFGGEQNQVQAMKCAVYGYTPAWVAGILHLFPVLGLLVLLASLYGIYLCYLGLPVLMKAPREKAAGYTFVVILCAIVLSLLLSVVAGLLGFAGGADRLGTGDAIFGRTREAAPAPDSVLGKLDTLGKKLDESNRKMEEAGRKGDTAAAASAAMESIATMASGGRKVEPIAVDRLRQFLPEALDGMPRSDVTTEQTSFGPVSVTTASATYRDGSRKVRVNVGDMAAAGGLFALTTLMGAAQIRETDAGYEKMQRVDGRFVIEKQDKRSGAAEYSVVLADHFIVNASSDNVDAQALRAMIAKLDTAKLEAMKDVGVAK